MSKTIKVEMTIEQLDAFLDCIECCRVIDKDTRSRLEVQCMFARDIEKEEKRAAEESKCPGNDNSKPTGWVCNRCNSSFCPSLVKDTQ